MGYASSPGCALVVTSFACSAQVPPDCQCCPVTVFQASGPPPGACLLLPCLLHCLLAALSLCSPVPQHTGLMLRLNKSYTPDKHHPCTPISLLRNRLSERCGVRSGHARAKKHVPTAGSIRSSLIGPVQPLQPCVSTSGTISVGDGSLTVPQRVMQQCLAVPGWKGTPVVYTVSSYSTVNLHSSRLSSTPP